MALSAGVHNYLSPTWCNYKVKVSSSLPRQHTHHSSSPPESTWPSVLCRWGAEHPLPHRWSLWTTKLGAAACPPAATSFQKLQEAWGRRASQAHGRSLLWDHPRLFSTTTSQMAWSAPPITCHCATFRWEPHFYLVFRLQNTEITTFYYTKIQAQQSWGWWSAHWNTQTWKCNKHRGS